MTASPSFLLIILLGIFSSVSISPLLAEDIITRPSDMMEGIDKEVLKQLRTVRGEAPPKDAVEKADQKLQTFGDGKKGSMRFKVSEVRKNDKGNIELSTDYSPERVSGISMEVCYTIIVDPSQNSEAAKIKVGDRIAASGTPWASIFWAGKSKEYRFSFCLHKDITLER